MGDPVADILEQVRTEETPAGDEPSTGSTLSLRRLCHVATRLVGVRGAAINVVATDGAPQLRAASDGVERPLEGLQQVIGAGPGAEAFETSRPVLVPDLDAVDPTRWPGYPGAARADGIRAVFAVPLQVGAVRLGSLELYRSEPGGLAADELTSAFSLADAAVSLLLDEHFPIEGALVGPAASLPYRAEIFQAQGMVMMQLGVSLREAMLRLRAHAFVNDADLADVARQVVDHRLRLHRSDEEGGSYDGPVKREGGR
ncbi:MAG TPA: GAF and ANTAR domain-containing protein [Nocardioidaceae bacterium]|jgi:hypothetical protein|nr:GAF and ANTAR domain-containing protein [Nocardioidaceae bacterium]